MLYRDSAEQASAASAELATYLLTYYDCVLRDEASIALTNLHTAYYLRRAPPPPSSRRGCKVRSRRSR